jgi:hypothetical protein
LEPVYDAIRNHATRHQLISPTTRILGQKLNLGKNVALSAAAKIAGCGEKRFLQISDALELPLVEQPVVGTHIVPTANVEIVTDLIASSIEATELARQLGCRATVITRLVDGGMLGLKLPGNVTATDLIDRSDAEKLISVISEEFDEIIDLKDQHITAKQATRLAVFGIVGVLTAIISRNIRGIGRIPGNPGFMGVIFDRRELLEAVCSIFGTALYRDIISCYGWGTSTLLQLKRMGYLDADLRSDYIYVEELKKFMADHVSMNEMIDWQEAPNSWGAIRRILRECGVQPTVPSSHKVSAFWPRKAAREALARASIDRKQLHQHTSDVLRELRLENQEIASV